MHTPEKKNCRKDARTFMRLIESNTQTMYKVSRSYL